MDYTIHDPIVLDVPPPDKEAIWRECDKAMNAVQNPDGSTNWRAAFAADPGAVRCPACLAYHWSIGHWHKCTQCGFIYPYDAGCMFAYGRQQAFEELEHPNYGRDPDDPDAKARLARFYAQRMRHPYYKYGYEHPGDPSLMWTEAFAAVKWRNVFPNPEVIDLKGIR